MLEYRAGTRAIFEQVLESRGYTPERFRRVVCINNFSVICSIAAAGEGISFVYESIAKSMAGGQISRFHIRDIAIMREFNYVYLKDTDAAVRLDAFAGAQNPAQPKVHQAPREMPRGA